MHRRSLRVALTTGASMGLATLAAALLLPGSAPGHGKVICAGKIQHGAIRSAEVGWGTFDPIVAPGEDPFMPVPHSHTFLTNQRIVVGDPDRPNLDPYVREFATYGPPMDTHIVGAQTNCSTEDNPNDLRSNPDDTAAYWFPTLFGSLDPDAGRERLRVDQLIAYYYPGSSQSGSIPHPNFPNDSDKRIPNRHIQTNGIVEYQEDMRLVAGRRSGHDDYDPADPLNKFAWFDCGTRHQDDTPKLKPENAGCNADKYHRKDTPGGPGHLMLKVWFPDCWDGDVNPHPPHTVWEPGDPSTADFSDDGSVVNHLSYSTVNRATHKVECNDVPVSPQNPKLPLLQLQVHFDYAKSGEGVLLGSDDPDHNLAWINLHADFWNTWIQHRRDPDRDDTPGCDFLMTDPPQPENCGQDLNGDGLPDEFPDYGGLRQFVSECVNNVRPESSDVNPHHGNSNRCGTVAVNEFD
jgi:Domain of unknown function (DUF1996)